MKRLFARILPAAFLLVLLFVPGACKKKAVQFRFETDADVARLIDESKIGYVPATFMVLSDVHLYDTTLGTKGAAFEAYLADDRKLLVESEAILDEAVAQIVERHPQFVLFTGDSTKDGERQCHELFASYLARIEAAGISVYTIAGNHDINNPHALRYDGADTHRVENVTPQQFAAIYGAYGYGEAIERDPNSLAYVAEPLPGLWLLNLDSCRYDTNEADNRPRVSGEYGARRLAWIESMLIRSKKEGKAVIAAAHHGFMEHYATQKRFYGDYVVDDYRDISRLLAAYHVRAAFTGHFHAQDISVTNFADGNALYDIETGSLATYPCPYRWVQIDEAGCMHIRSHFIGRTSLHEEGFRDYARQYVRDGIAGMASDTLGKLRVSKDDASALSPQIAEAFVAHYIGDERAPLNADVLDTKGTGIMAKIVAFNRRPLIEGLWKDLEPADNDLVIDLVSGETK